MKPCKKCGAIERNKYGHCRVCHRRLNRAWQIANPEKHTARNRVWQIANPERMRAYNRTWKIANPEKRKACERTWKIANHEKRRIYWHNRRARKLSNGGILSKDLSDKLFKQQKGKCACCYEPLGSNYHLDHIMPLALGGKNEDWNIQLLRAECNSRKGAKHPIVYMQEKGFLL